MLIVDDDAVLRSLVATVLTLDHGWHCAGEARNGREALARVAELGPEAILLDLHMPVLDGRRALPLLRTAAPAAAIVVLSAGEIGAVRLCELRALGADSAVEKGVSLGELRQAVVSAVADRRTTTA